MVQCEAEALADGRWRCEERQCNNQPDERDKKGGRGGDGATLGEAMQQQ